MSTAKKSTAAKPKTVLYDNAPTSRVSPIAKPARSDMDRLQAVAQQLLRQLEASLKKTSRASEAVLEVVQKKHDLLFGAKSSHVSALVTLAELILKLDQAKTKRLSPAGEYPAYHGEALSEGDVALVEAFVQRMKNQQAG